MKLIRPEPPTDELHEKFVAVRRELAATLIERDEEIDLVSTALLANEHVLPLLPAVSKQRSHGIPKILREVNRCDSRRALRSSNGP